MSANICRDTATSAIWKGYVAPVANHLAPILDQPLEFSSWATAGPGDRFVGGLIVRRSFSIHGGIAVGIGGRTFVSVRGMISQRGSPAFCVAVYNE
jgi:hypothetical protein